MSNGKSGRRSSQMSAKQSREAESLYDSARQQAENRELPGSSDLPSPSTLGDELKQAREAKRLFDNLSKEVEKRSKKVDENTREIELQHKALSARENTMLERESEVDRQTNALSERTELLNERERALLAREEQLATREADADAGFLSRHSEHLQRFQDRLIDANAKVDDELSGLLEARLDWERERRTREYALQIEAEESNRQATSKAQQRLEELLAREDQLKVAEDKLQRRERELGWIEDDLNDLRNSLDARVESVIATRCEELIARNEAIESQLDLARRRRDELEQELDEAREASRALGGKAPAEILSSLTALRRERDSLRIELANRPTLEERELLRQMQQEREAWTSESLQLRADLSESRLRLARAGIAVTEIETLRDQKAVLEASLNAYRADMEDRRREFEELTTSPNSVGAFPTFTAKDNELSRQRSVELDDSDLNLKALVLEARDRMAAGESAFYYDLSTVRSFLGGLAMSQLHLLHGISGTGKTSLPREFAKALGAGHSVVSVQAGWRDRHDLIGHFNEFEKRFHGTEFIAALYEAQCPRWEDQPYFIVLDEMNLSHPEQYFADLLSAIERPLEERFINVVDNPHPAPPKLFVEGQKLRVPENVWFIGTANHDETTREFAPKTYDRAHVMQLPRQRSRFEPRGLPARAPVTFAGLHRAWVDAQRTYSAEAAQANEYLHNTYADLLGDDFGIGWGNRLESQIGKYVPVVIAAGGSLGEAVDHILSSKILYKLKGRFDLSRDALLALSEVVEGSLPALGGSYEPRLAINLVRDELARVGASGGL